MAETILDFIDNFDRVEIYQDTMGCFYLEPELGYRRMIVPDYSNGRMKDRILDEMDDFLTPARDPIPGEKEGYDREVFRLKPIGSDEGDDPLMADIRRTVRKHITDNWEISS